MSRIEASIPLQHSFSETEKTEVDAESTKTEHECVATNSASSTGDIHTTAACRVLERRRVMPITAADLLPP